MFDFNANIIAERITEVENSRFSARRTVNAVMTDFQQCFSEDVRVVDLLSGENLATSKEFFAAFQQFFKKAEGQTQAARVKVFKRVYMQRRNCNRASATATFALDFKQYAPEAAQVWASLGQQHDGATEALDLACLFVAIKNKIQIVFVAIDSDGLGADESATLETSSFSTSPTLVKAQQIAANLSDESMGDLDTHFNNYHSIEEVTPESLLAKLAQQP